MFPNTGERYIGYITFDLEGQEALNEFVAKHVEGGFINYPAYTSTSKVPDAYVVEGELTAHLEIYGENGHDISSGLGLEEEQEVLFARNSRFVVKSLDFDGKTAKITLEEKGYGPEKSNGSGGIQGSNQRDNSRKSGSSDTSGDFGTMQQVQTSGQVGVQSISERNTRRNSRQQEELQRVREERVKSTLKDSVTTQQSRIDSINPKKIHEYLRENVKGYKARELAESRGLKVTFFTEANLHIVIDGKIASVRGYVNGDEVFVRADHPHYTADQIMRHEVGHDMISRGEVDVNEVRERIENRFGKENVQFIADRYADAYAGSDMTVGEIWEEIICDSLGDMNVFASKGVLGEINNDFLWRLKGEVNSSKKDARGPPSAEGKASRESRAKGSDYLIRHFSGKVNVDYSEIYVSDEELATISSSVKTGYGALNKQKNIGRVYTAEAFYIFSFESSGAITIRNVFDLETDSKIISYIEESLKNDRTRTRTLQTFDRWLDSVRNGQGRNEVYSGNAIQQTRKSGILDGVDGGASPSNAGRDIEQGVGSNQSEGKTSSKLDGDTVTVSRGEFDVNSADYNNFGWVRANNVINAGYWRNFTENFAQAVAGNSYYRKNKQGEYMIDVYDVYGSSEVADVVVFASGTIESPKVSKIIKIKSTDSIEIEETRRDIYAFERRGIQCETGELFDVYVEADVIRLQTGEANGQKDARYNNRLDTKRRASEAKANPIIEFYVNEDNGTITITYASGDTVTESINEGKGNGKSSKKLDGSIVTVSRGEFDVNSADYKNFGWVRANNIINAGYWRNFTENFAQAVAGDSYYRKNKQGEYMIDVYDVYGSSEVADVVVFASGTIESPNVTKIVKINLTDDTDIETKRSELYAAERKGIRRSFGEVFIFYNKSDFLGERRNQGDSIKGVGNNDRLDTKRRASEAKANPIIEFYVNEDKGTITTTYANGETVTESFNKGKSKGKASRELDWDSLEEIFAEADDTSSEMFDADAVIVKGPPTENMSAPKGIKQVVANFSNERVYGKGVMMFFIF